MIIEKYPKIFSRVKYLEVGNGWLTLLDNLCNLIQGHIDHIDRVIEWNKKNNRESDLQPIPQVVAIQVKEKFGELRFYYDGGDDYISGSVYLAEKLSRITCEECGNPGEIRNFNGYLKCVCDNHRKGMVETKFD